MPCKTPLKIALKQPKILDDGSFLYSVPVNCGKCLYCKKQRITGWSFRLEQEAKRANNVYFVTLTYDSENIPYCKIKPEAKIRTKEGLVNKYSESEIRDNITKVPTLCKSDVQDFMKRLRIIDEAKYGKKYKEVGEKNHEGYKDRVAIKDVFIRQRNKENYDYGQSLKYYSVGEYGTKNRRPHYHIVIFNLYDRESIDEAWKKGETDTKETHINSILYLLKYLEKETKHYKYIFAMDLQPEFSLMSKGLGENYVSPNVIAYHRDNYDNNVITLPDGTKGKLPRYLFNRLYNRCKTDHFNDEEKDKKDMDKYVEGMYRHFAKNAKEQEKKGIKVLGEKKYYDIKLQQSKNNLKFKQKKARD